MSYICRHGCTTRDCHNICNIICGSDIGNQPGYEPPTQEERNELKNAIPYALSGNLIHFNHNLKFWIDGLQEAHDNSLTGEPYNKSRAQILESLAYDNTDGPNE